MPSNQSRLPPLVKVVCTAATETAVFTAAAKKAG
jgi:hypothetical protein